MTKVKTPFQPLSTERLNEMAHVAVQYRQSGTFMTGVRSYIEKKQKAWRPSWVLAPAAAFTVVALFVFALQPSPFTAESDTLIAQVEEADVLVMLEENIY